MKHDTKAFIRGKLVVETDFVELSDGRILEMMEDSHDPARSVFPVNDKEGNTIFVTEYEIANCVYVPFSRQQGFMKHVRLATGYKPYESVSSLLRQIDSIFSQCVDLDENHRFLLSCFVLSTWLVDRLPIAPYVALLGLPGSGKTTVLKILRLLCRRSLLTADITSAAFYHICDRITPTLLIDETATVREKQALFHLLRVGTNRDVVAFCGDRSFNAYGAKVVCWTELPEDEALNSRCLIIPLQRSTRTDLTRPTAPEIVAAADDLQQQLLNHRFNYYRSAALAKIPGDERIHSRARDLYEALAISAGSDPGVCVRLLECFKLQKNLNGQPLPPSHTALLESLYQHIHAHPEKGVYSHLDLTTDVNLSLREMGEHICLSWRAVGRVLDSLGITNRKRINKGWVILLDRPTRKLVHDLMSAYNITQPSETLPPPQFLEECDICEDAREPRASEIGPAGSTAEDRPRNKWYESSIEDLLG
jgi:hypothetical protein